jgi:hypothetical protein
LWQILISVWGIALPFMVIKFASKEAWSAFVPVLLYTLMAAQLINWGNKEYLMRQFSEQPGRIAMNFTNVLVARLPLVWLSWLIGFMFFPAPYMLCILLWLTGRFLSHSAEVLVVYQKSFKQSILIESICFGGFCLAFLLTAHDNRNGDWLLLLFSFYQLAKGLCFTYLFREFIRTKTFSADFNFFRRAFPFLLLSAFGFLGSKADVYMVAYFCDEIVTSDYQVVNSLLVFIFSTSAFLYAPFTKNIYRNQENVLKKGRKIVALSGLVIIPVGLGFTHFVLQYYLKLFMPWHFYLLAFLYIYPSFIYGMRVVGYFRARNEKSVIKNLLLVAVCNACFAALFLSRGYGIEGALAGGVLSQWLACWLFRRL